MAPTPQQPLQAIAAGGPHSCILGTAGRAACWGLLDQKTPQPLSSRAPLITLATSRHGVCGLTASGALLCGAHDTLKPVDGRADDPIARVSMLAGGFTCAQRRSGAIGCAPAGEERAGLLSAAPIRDLEATAVLGAGPCVLQRSTVLCWSPPDTQARRIAGLADMVEVAADQRGGCARRRDGRVWCWGDNTYGRLGRAAPSGPAVQVEGVSAASALAIGRQHACALIEDGQVACWGRLWSITDQRVRTDCRMPAALQAPKTPPVYVCSRPSVVAGLPPARALAAGEGHSCAIGRDGAVYCWGGAGERLGEPWTRPARRYRSAAVTKLVW